MEPLLIIPVFIVLAIVIRLLAGGMDHDRVEQYISERGGKVLAKSWDPFGRGWFGDKGNRIYQVLYEDANGNVHQATCKTSMMSGVYLTEDRIVEQSNIPMDQGDVSDLLEENKKLRDEIRKLKRRGG